MRAGKSYHAASVGPPQWSRPCLKNATRQAPRTGVLPNVPARVPPRVTLMPLLPMLLASPLFEAGLERRPLTPRERQKLANAATRLQLPRGTRHLS